ncbi:MAG: AMP-binding protein, partial [candidate division Zixibacteria bacterium]|nr:AMP-binding protein [candidate division Zixibacteria bacterium]
MIFYPDKNKPYQQPEAESIYQLVKSRAEKDPDAIAIMAPERPPLSYGRLLNQVENTVERLRTFGLKRNDRVAIVLPNGPEMAFAFVAVAAAATCAPLNPSYRVNEFDFYISDLRARALMVWSEMDSPAREVAQKRNIPIIELTPTLKAETGIFELTGKNQALSTSGVFAQPDDTALVLHTSGTTSRPKIVPLTQTNICSSAHNISVTLELSEKDCCLNVMPLFHIHGLIGAVGSSLTAGASIVCTPGLDAERFFEWVDTFQPTWYTAVPTMHQAILARASANREIIARRPMRFIRSCSAALPEHVMAALEDVFGAPVIESYGMTEACHQMTSNPLPSLPRKPGSVGVAAGPDVAIMDKAGNLLSVGEIGEVVIRGINVTDGYENNPTSNQGAFTNGWFRTGDQGRFDNDGYLFLTGRLKEIINRGGEKIAPKEVDEILIQHPAITQAVAFAVPHVTMGEDVAAAVILSENAAVTESEIRDFVSARLADYKVPSQVLIVEEIPKGPTGKLQRIGLADKLALKLQNNFVAPKNSVEKRLAEVWTEVLNVNQVGVRDNFYALGGDSLAAALMTIEIENRFNAAISLAHFLRSPTIETIASLLQEQESSKSNASVVTGQAKGSKPIKDSFWSGLKNRLLQLVAL